MRTNRRNAVWMRETRTRGVRRHGHGTRRDAFPLHTSPRDSRGTIKSTIRTPLTKRKRPAEAGWPGCGRPPRETCRPRSRRRPVRISRERTRNRGFGKAGAKSRRGATDGRARTRTSSTHPWLC